MVVYEIRDTKYEIRTVFTGLIEKICSVKAIRKNGGGCLLTIDLGELANDSKIGDSIAVNGVCLTIVKLSGNLADFDVSGETLTKSNFGKLSPAAKVNIESAVRLGGRLGGHIVQGHIDGTAKIKKIEKQNQFANINFSADKNLLDQLVIKGSVAIDGVSLTIANIDKDSFSIAVIPETLKSTTLGEMKIGDCVNIEIDIVAKTIKKQIEIILPQKKNLTIEKLKELGF